MTILPTNVPTERAIAHFARNRTPRQGLKIALVNLMPNKAETEQQFARLLASNSYDVELLLVVPDGYVPKNTPVNHLRDFYRSWNDVRHERLDAVIVTGAPVELLRFEEVAYWSALSEIFEWIQSAGIPSLHVCWAAQAALYHYHGVAKHRLAHKAFGVYEQRIIQQGSVLLSGMGTSFPTPVSRHTEVRELDLPSDSGLDVLAKSAVSGLCLVEDRFNMATFLFNHLEYDAGSLSREYQRDLSGGKSIQVPQNYFPLDDPTKSPTNRWYEFARVLFENWLREVGAEAATMPGLTGTWGG